MIVQSPIFRYNKLFNFERKTMQINLSYFVVYKSHIVQLSNEETLEKFIEWIKEEGEFISLPWGDHVYGMESYLIDEEEFQLQEEVFTDCTLEIQNLIYNLKKMQLKENPDSKAQLVYEG